MSSFIPFAQQQMLRTKILRLNTLERLTKENYAEVEAWDHSKDYLEDLKQELKDIEEERESINRRLMLLKLKYGV